MDWKNISTVGRLPAPVYETELGAAFQGEAFDLLSHISDESVDLIITSPPFALQRQKEYGNKDQSEYVDWLVHFGSQIHRVLRDTGSFVIDIGGAYQKSRPVRSLHNYEVLLRLCRDFEFRLAEEFFWFNPAKLPSPIEWVNKRKIRAKDSVNTIWWLSKTDYPKADVNQVKTPYSDRMKRLLRDQSKYYEPKMRPSGHDISDRFGTDNGGAIPSNLLEIPNTESNSQYLRLCKEAGARPHPARFPEKLPTFFVKLLTDRNDLVVDIFAGSNTTGAVCERLGRRWLGFDLNRQYIATSAFRFFSPDQSHKAIDVYSQLIQHNSSSLKLECQCPSLGI